MGRLPATVITQHSLADLVELQRGYDLTAAERMPGQIPVIGGGGPNGTHGKANVKGPGVVVVRSGSGFGNVWWVEEDFWAHNTVMFAKSFKGNHKKFAYYVLDWLDFTSYNSGGAQPSLNRNFIYAIPVFLPSLPEQERIAGIIETWDRAIETVQALIANARAQKQALMQQLLPQGTIPPKKRLPGFSGEWREIRLGEAFTERVERGDDRLPLLSVTQVNGVIPQEDAGRRNISSEDQSNYKTVCAGDIAYNTMRMWQGASALSALTGKVSPAYTVVTPRKEHDALFYAYMFKQPKMIHVFERHSQGLVSDTWNLKFRHFAKIRTCVPDVEEQRAIAAAFQSLNDLAFAYETQLTAFRQEKAALMQQLLTGKRRVRLPESEVA